MWEKTGTLLHVTVGKQAAKDLVEVTGPRWPTMAAQDTLELAQSLAWAQKGLREIWRLQNAWVSVFLP